jgi:hemoglobin
MRRADALILGVALMAGCAVIAPPSLYDRLGGETGMEAIVDGAVADANADQRIAGYFRRMNIPRFKLLLADQLCEATGGPCTYTGEDMKAAHRNLHIDAAQFDAMLEDFDRSMQALKVAGRERTELLAVLAGMRGDIVSP